MIAISGCVRPQKYIDITCGKMPGETLLDRETAIQCQQFRQEEAATAVYSEATLLLKSYRTCLLKDIGLQIKELPNVDSSLTDTAQALQKSK